MLLDGGSPKHLHFQVRQRSGVLCDVFRTVTIGGSVRWSCNASTEEKGSHRGCVLFGSHIESVPSCSHAKACELWLRGDGL